MKRYIIQYIYNFLVPAENSTIPRSIRKKIFQDENLPFVVMKKGIFIFICLKFVYVNRCNIVYHFVSNGLS